MAQHEWFYVARHLAGEALLLGDEAQQPVEGHLLDGLRRRAVDLSIVRVPSEEEERDQAFTRQRQQIVRERQRLQAMGRSLLASHGIHVTGKWWTGRTWRLVGEEAPAWVVERLRTLVRLIEPMEAEEKAMTAAI